jgi:DNA-binding NtrC family response regulator
VLVALGGGAPVRAYPLSDGVELILGRDVDCDVVLSHHRVSRRHARLCVSGAGDALAIEDLGSRNGTRVREPLKRNQPCPVQAGDAIGIGPFTLTAVRGGGATPPSLVVEDPHVSAPSPALLGIASDEANVIVSGMTAEAKRTLAESLHRHSGREGRFIALDCAAIGPERIEAELFGDGARPGALDAAANGTLLLEEIGELPLAVQAQLLQAIENLEASCASGEPPTFTARLVCTTDRDLLAAVEARAFRPDLFYRLAGATLTLRQPRALTSDQEAERAELVAAIEQADGNLTRAARRLGIGRNVLVARMAQYRIPRPPPRHK